MYQTFIGNLKFDFEEKASHGFVHMKIPILLMDSM